MVNRSIANSPDKIENMSFNNFIGNFCKSELLDYEKATIENSLFKGIDDEINLPVTVSKNGKQLEEKFRALERLFSKNIYTPVLEESNLDPSYTEEYHYKLVSEGVFSDSYKVYRTDNKNNLIRLDLKEDAKIISDDDNHVYFTNICDVLVRKIEDAILTLSTNCITTKKYILFLYKVLRLVFKIVTNAYNTEDSVELEYTNQSTGDLEVFEEHRNKTLKTLLEEIYSRVDPQDIYKDDSLRIASSISEELGKQATFSKNSNHLIHKLELLKGQIAKVGYQPNELVNTGGRTTRSSGNLVQLVFYLKALTSRYYILFLKKTIEDDMLDELYVVSNSRAEYTKNQFRLVVDVYNARFNSVGLRSNIAVSASATNFFLDKLFEFLILLFKKPSEDET